MIQQTKQSQLHNPKNLSSPKKSWNRVNEFCRLLLDIKTQSLSGIVEVRTDSELKWIVECRRGKLSWVTGGDNCQERYQRHFATIGLQIDGLWFEETITGLSITQEYNLLLELQDKSQLTNQQLSILMTNMAREILFDIIQYFYNSEKKVFWKFNYKNFDSKLELLPLVEIETTLTEVMQGWKQWYKEGLAPYSPNLFPKIKNLHKLQEYNHNNTLTPISPFIDGTVSLRGLASQNQWNLLKLTKYMVLMVQLDAIVLNPVSNNDRFTKNLSNLGLDNLRHFSEVFNKENAIDRALEPSYQPLVICIDDSPLVCRIMEEIVKNQGYRFLSIQQSPKSILTVLKTKPDFIFLDLLMPIVNGYELCTQLRRIPTLQDVPIVILTAKEGFLERMRTKLRGSTDFMSKPINEQSVITIMDKYLMVTKSEIV